MSKQLPDPWAMMDGVAVCAISELDHICGVEGKTLQLPNGEKFKDTVQILRRCEKRFFHGELAYWELPDGSVKIFND